MLRRFGIFTFGLSVIGALSAGCGSDHAGSQDPGHAGASGIVNGDPDQQTGAAGAPGAGGFTGVGSGTSGSTGSAGGPPGSGPGSGASVQFVLKEVH